MKYYKVKVFIFEFYILIKFIITNFRTYIYVNFFLYFNVKNSHYKHLYNTKCFVFIMKTHNFLP